MSLRCGSRIAGQIDHDMVSRYEALWVLNHPEASVHLQRLTNPH
jgi:hypothetical protein